MPLNFWIIVSVQWIVFFFLAYNAKTKTKLLIPIVLYSVLAGIFIGAFFDITGILLGIHAYIVPFPLWVLIMNGIFSFGASVATAYYLVPKLPTPTKRSTSPILLLLIACLSIAGTIYFNKTALLVGFLQGITVAAFGEALAAFKNRPGLVFPLIRDSAQGVRIWFLIVIIGIVYELTNYFFRFWAFFPSQEIPLMFTEALVVVCGYAVLFHPMIIFWQLLRKR